MLLRSQKSQKPPTVSREAASLTDKPFSYLRARSRKVTALLQKMWRETKFPKEFSLVAVGGFARRELFPGSDVDLLILLPHDSNERESERIAQWVARLWDAGIEPGHSVRTIAESKAAALSDITIQTNLLEGRCIAGSRATWMRTLNALRADLDLKKFCEQKLKEQAERDLRFQSSTHVHEPNCKESPGGLRDAHLMGWLALAAGLPRQGTALMNKDERRVFRHCVTFLTRLRLHLHLLTGRKEDRLLFEHQADLAKQLGVPGRTPLQRAEALMKQYYRCAKSLRALSNLFVRLLIEKEEEVGGGEKILNKRFAVHGQELSLRGKNVFRDEASAILECFSLLQTRDYLTDFSVPTLRMLWSASHKIDAAFRKNPEHRIMFRDLFMNGHRVGPIISRMHELNILGAYLPAFGKVVGQMQYDLFHAFTVDQHTLNVLGNLHEFTLPRAAQDFPLASELMIAHSNPGCLYLAAIFHDIAKGRGGDHSVLGEKDARKFCQEHGVSAADTDLICWLVRHHLALSHVAQKEDLEDPMVLTRFAELVGDELRLKNLYLLTVADIRGTAPKLWNSWRSRLIEQVYFSVLNILRGTGKTSLDVEERKKEVRSCLSRLGSPEGMETSWWRDLHVSYFQRHDVAEILWHTLVLSGEHVRDRLQVRARLRADVAGLEVMAWLPHASGLLARLCEFFVRLNYSIVQAKLFRTEDEHALCTLLLLDGHGHDIAQEMIDFVEHELPLHLTEAASLTPVPMVRPSRQVRYFPLSPTIRLAPVEPQQQQRHILLITAADRPGLLYAIVRVLDQEKLDIENTRVTTLGGRAEDVFTLLGNPDAERLEQKLLEVIRI